MKYYEHLDSENQVSRYWHMISYYIHIECLIFNFQKKINVSFSFLQRQPSLRMHETFEKGTEDILSTIVTKKIEMKFEWKELDLPAVYFGSEHPTLIFHNLQYFPCNT